MNEKKQYNPLHKLIEEFIKNRKKYKKERKNV